MTNKVHWGMRASEGTGEVQWEVGRRAGGHGVILEESRQRESPWSPHPKKRRREAAGGGGVLAGSDCYLRGRELDEWLNGGGGPWPSPHGRRPKEPNLTLALGGEGRGPSE